MKKRLSYLILIIIFTSTIGGLYLYTIKADNDTYENKPAEVPEKQADETIISNDPTTFINNGTAPEFSGLTSWLNSDNPLTLDQFRGKVVLVDFWTYSCIDCTRAIPSITDWYNKYKDQGLVVIGIHTPQYAFEKVTGNVTNAISAQKIPYPVALDNNYKTWSAYHNQFWPAMYLIDQNGNIVYSQIGGGKYGQTEKAIRTLLGMEGDYKIPPPPDPTNPEQPPDIYTGSTKINKSFGDTETLGTSEQIFTFPKKLAKNKIGLEGPWRQDQESIIHTKNYGRLLLNFNSAQLNMIASSPEPVTVKVYVDDILIKGVVIKESGSYQLFDSLTAKNHTLRLEIPDSTLQIMSFIFS